MMKINRIQLLIGEEEQYYEDQIEQDPKLLEMCNVLINRSGVIPFSTKINRERGTLIINLDEKEKLISIDLVGVSASLYFEFMNR